MVWGLLPVALLLFTLDYNNKTDHINNNKGTVMVKLKAWIFKKAVTLVNLGQHCKEIQIRPSWVTK